MSKRAISPASRRTVLTGLALSGAAAVVMALPVLRDSAGKNSSAPRFSGRRKPLPQASYEQWTSEIGSIFYAATEAGAFALTLTTVTALPVVGKRPASLRARPFEVTFEAVAGKALPAGDRLYPLRHDAYGDFQLYFSSVDKALKATFN